MNQLTSQQAVAFAEGDRWKRWTDAEISGFQFSQDYLCFPFRVFHKALETVLRRSVFTHEFARTEILEEEYLVAMYVEPELYPKRKETSK